MHDPEDYWAAEDFEDTVAAALIACFETKIFKNKGAVPADGLNEERIQILRRAGPYIPGRSRVVLLPDLDSADRADFDVISDPLPLSGCYSWRSGGREQAHEYNGYLMTLFIRQTNTLAKHWVRQAGGTLYEATMLSVEDRGITGERFFYSVTKDGHIVSCDARIPAIRGYGAGMPATFISHEPKILREREIWSSIAMQMLADRRFCWTITAQEKMARAHLGCMQEEVKSLLYARSLPMTSNGRKRPILHLVEAHKRRMRNGTDIDITAFLRGQQTVEIAGTAFSVNPPAAIKAQLSEASKRRFFERDGAA